MASHVIGHMGDDTLDDPLSERYKRIGCSISPVDKDSDDYKMILNYLDKNFRTCQTCGHCKAYPQDLHILAEV